MEKNNEVYSTWIGDRMVTFNDVESFMMFSIMEQLNKQTTTTWMMMKRNSLNQSGVGVVKSNLDSMDLDSVSKDIQIGQNRLDEIQGYSDKVDQLYTQMQFVQSQVQELKQQIQQVKDSYSQLISSSQGKSTSS